MLVNMKLALLALLSAATVQAQWTARIEGALCKKGGRCLNDCDMIKDILYEDVLPRARAKESFFASDGQTTRALSS